MKFKSDKQRRKVMGYELGNQGMGTSYPKDNDISDLVLRDNDIKHKNKIMTENKENVNSINEYKRSLKLLTDNELKDESFNLVYKSDTGLGTFTTSWYNQTLSPLDNAATIAFNLPKVSMRPINTDKLNFAKEVCHTFRDTINDEYKRISIPSLIKLKAISDENIYRIYAPSKKIKLYRGIMDDSDAFKDVKINQKVKLKSYNLSSWTSDLNVAKEFAEWRKGTSFVIVQGIFDIKDILYSMDIISSEDWEEQHEFVVMRTNNKEAEVIRNERISKK